MVFSLSLGFFNNGFPLLLFMVTRNNKGTTNTRPEMMNTENVFALVTILKSPNQKFLSYNYLWWFLRFVTFNVVLLATLWFTFHANIVHTHCVWNNYFFHDLYAYRSCNISCWALYNVIVGESRVFKFWSITTSNNNVFCFLRNDVIWIIS